MFIVIMAANLFFYFFVYGDLSQESYFESEHRWGDQFRFKLFSTSEEYKPSFKYGIKYGASLYPVYMYRIFQETMLWSLLINSVLFYFAICNLLQEKKRFAITYIVLLLPFICYFSVGFTKEPLIVLGLSLFYRFTLNNRLSYALSGLFIVTISKPFFALTLIPVCFSWFRTYSRNILIVLLFLTPVYFWIFPFIFGDTVYFTRYSNFENSLRSTYPILSFVGNVIAMLKLYLEPLFRERGAIHDYIVIWFWFVNVVFMSLCFKSAINWRSHWYWYLFLALTFIPIVHYRYLMPVLFVWTYSILPQMRGRFSVLTHRTSVAV